MEPVNGSNKDVCGAKLQPMTVLAYPVDCDCLCYLLDTAVCVLMVALTCLWLPTHPLIHAICDITVTVKNVVQNPAVLAS